MANSLSLPQVITGAFAYAGDKNTIPNVPSTTSPQLANIQTGFPAITQVPPELGGIPPERNDFNGIFNLLSSFYVYTQNGGTYTFEQTVSDAIGGYPKGATLYYTDSLGNTTLVRSLINDNTFNFNLTPTYIDDGVHWKTVSTGIQTVGTPVGAFVGISATSSYIPEGCVPCNGAQYSRAQFPTFYDGWLNGKIATISYTEYANQISTYGFCDKFGLDATAQTFKVPTRNKLRKLVKKYRSGNTYYELYDDGWCIQGGYYSGNGKYEKITVPLLRPFLNRDYFVQSNIDWGDMVDWYSGVNATMQREVCDIAKPPANKGTTSFSTASSSGGWWIAFGYTAVPNSTADAEVEFVVLANSPVNQSQMDWSAYQTALQGRLTVDVSNITTLGKKNISSFDAPKYSATTAVEFVNNSYTAPSNGYLVIQTLGNNATFDGAIGNLPIHLGGNFGNYHENNTVMYRVSAGDIASYTEVVTTTVYFIPCVGG